MDGAGLSKGESWPSGQPPSSAQGETSAPGGGRRRCWLLSSPISLATFFLHSSLVSEVELWWGSFRLGNKRQVAQVACSLAKCFNTSSYRGRVSAHHVLQLHGQWMEPQLDLQGGLIPWTDNREAEPSNWDMQVPDFSVLVSLSQ